MPLIHHFPKSSQRQAASEFCNDSVEFGAFCCVVCLLRGGTTTVFTLTGVGEPSNPLTVDQLLCLSIKSFRFNTASVFSLGKYSENVGPTAGQNLIKLLCINELVSREGIEPPTY